MTSPPTDAQYRPPPRPSPGGDTVVELVNAETTPQGVTTVLGLPLNPIDHLGLVTPIRFYNLFEGIFPNAANLMTKVPDGTENPILAINYLQTKSDVIERSVQQRPLVRLADRNLNIVASLTSEMSMEFEELMTDSGSAKYVVRWDNWLVDYMVNLTATLADLHLVIDPIPTAPTWRTRWGGKIHTINIARHNDGTSTVELLAVANREHAKRLLFAATPFFPPEVQPLRMFVLPGPIRTILFISCFINLARLFVPGLSFLSNIFNPASWLDPLSANSLFNFNPLNWPIQVAFVNPARDTSSWNVLGATWTDWHSATQDMLGESGTMMRVYTWLTEDVDSPYNELTDLLGLSVFGEANLIRPLRNCVIFSFEDKSGVHGPTGSVLDGLLSFIGITLDDLITSALVDVNTGVRLDGEPVLDVNGNPVPIIESLLGVAPTVPKVIWREGEFSGLIEATHTIHKAPPRTVMTGGRSPALVNQLQTFGIRYALSQLSDVLTLALGVSATFTPDNFAWQNIGTPGLDNLYQGQLDNILFAWERITDPLRALYTGDLAFQEYFDKGSSTAYTLSGIITLQTALWKTRPFQGLKVKVRNGRPWIVNRDTLLGDRNGFEFSGVIYVDQLYGIKCSVDRKKPLLWELQVGEDKNKFNPIARLVRAAQGIYSIVSAFAGEGTLFG